MTPEQARTLGAMSRKNKTITADELRFAHIASSVRSAGVLQMKGFCHHGSVSTYQHSIRVAWCAYRINRKLHLGGDEAALVRAGFLHDYFGYDWHHTSNNKHAINHPQIAEGRARREFGLTPKEQNIILAHMWPLPPNRVPKCREAWLICLADKLCALEETLFMR